VTVVRTEYAEAHPDVVEAFLSDYAQSVEAANTDLAGTAALCEEQGVVAKAAIAQKALPYCNIVLQTGAQMQANVSAYLQVLYDADPAAVGGALPDDAFYYAE
jgi:NitT/TauT family transport system substrate-binding protein